MQVAVTARHLDITDSMKNYAEEKTGKLARYYDRIDQIEVLLDRESLQYRVEVVVHTDHAQTFVGHVDAGNFHEAVDLVSDKMERQILKHKEKLRNRKHPAEPA